MRKVFFTAILLLVFGTTWMLYLEYDSRRFIENLPKAPTPVTRAHSTAEAPVTPESSETMAPVTSPLETESETEVADMSTAHTDVHSQTHTEETSQPESTDFLSEAPIFENDFKDVDESSPHRSAKQFLMEELGRSEAEIERRRASEILKRIMSQNRIEGPPGTDGFSFVVTIADANDFKVVLDKLSEGPPPAGLRLLPRKTRKATGTRIVKFRGVELHLPDFKDSPAQAR